MKSHYCHKEQTTIEFSGQCNWCGEKEMNANELADVFNTYDEPHDWGIQAANMLRKQQEKLTKYELRHAEQRKRIEELEAELKLIDELVRGTK